MKLTTLSVIGRDLLNNIAYNKVKRPYSMLFYIIESGNWSIKWDGKYITNNLNNQKLLNARITRTYKGIQDQIIHFGSANTFNSKGIRLQNKSNRIVLTWFHFVPDDPRIKSFKEAQKYVDVVHTSSAITREKLIEIGIPEEKIVVIPLGVDLNIFKPVPEARKNRIRKELGLPQDKVIIGSFQKDGVGWADGLEPKQVKGPDIFVDVIDNLSRDHNIFVLLTGPARGYVKKGLDRIGVPYKHIFLKKYLDIPKYYNVLDLYLLTSRAEGGPKAILEAMATGVPVVSTKVGMAPDTIKEGYNGLLAEVEDVAVLSEKANKIIADKKLANRLVDNALNTIKDYSWEKIAKRYYGKIYSRFLTR